MTVSQAELKAHIEKQIRRSSRPVVPTITQADVDRCVSLKAQVDALESERQELSTRIKEAMLAGAKCPAGGPYLLVLVTQNRQRWQYKDILAKVITMLTPRVQAAALKLVESLQSEKVPVSCLTVKPNSEWENDNGS